MSLRDQLVYKLKQSLKNKLGVETNTLRLLLAKIKDLEIDKKTVLNDEEVLAVLTKQSKQRQEAIELYQQGKRPELAAREKQEKEIIDGFLPKQMSREEVGKIVDQVMEKNPNGNFGQIMSQVMNQLGKRAEGKLVAGLVKEKLG